MSEPARMNQPFRLSGLQKRNRSGLIPVSLGHCRGDEFLASVTARARAIGGAPIRKCVRIDVNAHDDVSVGLESALHFLGNRQPLLPGAWHLVAVGEKLQE